MRYRKLDANGDYVFGNQQHDFWIDQPEGVGQAALTRLELQYGEWWLDVTDGTPWLEEVLGMHTQATRDPAIQARIMGTEGFQTLQSYTSQLSAQRVYSVQASFDTIYGPTTITGNI